jgi:hypothetical protein
MKPESTRFLHVPQTEQEVVCLFGALLDDLDEFERPLIIERVQTAFPDCIVRAGGSLIRIEFELYGSNFDHDCANCDMLICWRDNRNDWPEAFQVLQLADVVATKKRQGMFVSLDEGFSAPWNEDTFVAAATRDGASARDIALARKIIELAHQGTQMGADLAGEPKASLRSWHSAVLQDRFSWAHRLSVLTVASGRRFRRIG